MRPWLALRGRFHAALVGDPAIAARLDHHTDLELDQIEPARASARSETPAGDAVAAGMHACVRTSTSDPKLVIANAMSVPVAVTSPTRGARSEHQVTGSLPERGATFEAG